MWDVRERVMKISGINNENMEVTLTKGKIREETDRRKSKKFLWGCDKAENMRLPSVNV